MKKLSFLLALAFLVANPSADASTMVKYVNQKAGQFCKKVDIGKFVLAPSTGKLKCLMAKGASRARWTHA
ncbi:MAG: hypothetical protein Q8K86_08750 [Candidatus Nanopelagicaceae bacterium]|nr:hypothetical protein [Candidatus Nanopelagicaceae bacterium]